LPSHLHHPGDAHDMAQPPPYEGHEEPTLPSVHQPVDLMDIAHSAHPDVTEPAPSMHDHPHPHEHEHLAHDPVHDPVHAPPQPEPQQDTLPPPQDPSAPQPTPVSPPASHEQGV